MFMKKKVFSVLVAAVMVVAMSATPVFAQGHGGGGHHRARVVAPAAAVTPTAAVRHDATDYYLGHYSDQCAQYDHVWYDATDFYAGHYAYDCDNHGHALGYHDSGYHHRG